MSVPFDRFPPFRPAGPEVVSLVPFYAAAALDATCLELPLQAEALTELEVAIDSGATRRGLRTWVDLSHVSRFRLAVRVEESGQLDAFIAIQFSLDGTTWAFADGALGPWCAIDNTGDVRGPQSRPDPKARGDVLLRPVALQGDGTMSPVLGSIMLHVWFLASDIALPVATNNPIPGGVNMIHQQRVMGDDWIGGRPGIPIYLEADALFTFAFSTMRLQYTAMRVRDTGLGLHWDLDTVNLFAFHRTLASYFGDNNDATAELLGARLVGSLSDGGIPLEVATQYDDVWFRQTLSIEAGLVSPAVDPGDDTGLELIAFTTQGTPRPTLFDGLIGVQLKLVAGRIKLVAINGTDGDPADYTIFDLGPDTDLIGAGWQDLVIRLQKTSATQWRFRVYLGAASTTPLTLYGDEVHTVGPQSSTVFTDFISGYRMMDMIGGSVGLNATAKAIRLARWEMIPQAVVNDPWP